MLFKKRVKNKKEKLFCSKCKREILDNEQGYIFLKTLKLYCYDCMKKIKYGKKTKRNEKNIKKRRK